MAVAKKYSAYLDEWFPVLQLAPEGYIGHKKSAEFSDEEVARIKAAAEEFYSVQKMIHDRFGVGPVSWDGELVIEDDYHGEEEERNQGASESA